MNCEYSMLAAREKIRGRIAETEAQMHELSCRLRTLRQQEKELTREIVNAHFSSPSTPEASA